MSRAVRLYARVVRLYPRAFREAYGEDMVALFAAQLQDEPRTRVWTRAAGDLAMTLPTRHVEAHMRLPSRSVPLLAVGTGVLAAVTAVIGGPVVIGAIVALVALTFAYVAWRRDQPVSEPGARPGRRSVLLLGAGAAALAGLAFAPQDGPEGLWFVYMAVLLAGISAVTVGAIRGIDYLTQRQRA